jgi:hypothetical protein
MEELKNLFDEVQARIARFVPPFTVFERSEGRKRKNVFFASVILYPTYVGFYYMPVYAQPEIAALFSPDLLSLLKGKSCFHLKRGSEALLQDIEDALAKGFALYKEKGWVR